ncbi:protein AMN1 homolog [Euwallacea fornicatus]|uniref:protein AMN1 homolog n=1 Tax=Euwallacea fornicatus TaxID=995702 RepID=UPI00338DB316
MSTRYYLSSVNSLFSITLDYILIHLTNFQLEELTILPSTIKNLLLKRLQFTKQLLGNPLFNDYLKAFVNDRTSQVNLSCILVNDEILNTLSSCPNLKRLDLTEDGSICQFTNEGLSKLLMQITNLNIFIAMKSDAVTDDVLKILSTYCKQIHGINVGGCQNISDKGLAFLRNMELKWLKISETQVTDEGIAALVEGKCGQTLNELSIDNCHKITDIGLRKLTECCPNLRVISFISCGAGSAFTDTLSFTRPVKQLFWEVK